MKRKLIIAFAGAALSFGVAASAANAAPAGLTPLSKIAGSESLVEKTHGWHRACVRGPRGWRHRHVRGRTISCGPRARVRVRDCHVNRRGKRVCVWRWRWR